MSGKGSFSKISTLLLLFPFSFLFLSTATQSRTNKTERRSDLPGLRKLSDKPPATAKRKGKQPEKRNDRIYTLKTRVTLGDGRIVSGTTRFQAPEKVTVRHLKDGVPYTRNVRISDIVRVEIQSWKADFLRRNRQGEIFQFDVSGFDLVLQDETRLHPEGGLYPFLRRLQLKNDNGRVVLYTYWIDLLRKDGTWFTGLPVLPGRVRKKCHQDVIRRIEFGTGQPAE